MILLDSEVMDLLNSPDGFVIDATFLFEASYRVSLGAPYWSSMAMIIHFSFALSATFFACGGG